MSRFEIEFHLPAKVFKRAPFIYIGADSRSLILGAFSDLVKHKGANLQRTYPLLVSRRSSDGLQEGQLFSLAFLYIDDDERRRLHLTHPILLEDGDEILETLISGAKRLAISLGCASIDIEVHKVSGPVSFPSSISPISYDLNKATLLGLDSASLLKRGFRVEEEIKCLNADIEDFEGRLNIQERTNEYITPLLPSEFRKIEKEPQIFPIRSYTLSRADAAINFNENIPLYEGMAYIMWKRGRGGSKEGEVKGFIRWCPNLFEALEMLRTPYPLLFKDHLPEYRYGLGKVFDWGFRARDENLIIQLLSSASEAMRGRGIKGIQLGFVDSRNGFLERILGKYGFKVVHRIEILRRAV